MAQNSAVPPFGQWWGTQDCGQWWGLERAGGGGSGECFGRGGGDRDPASSLDWGGMGRLCLQEDSEQLAGGPSFWLLGVSLTLVT